MSGGRFSSYDVFILTTTVLALVVMALNYLPITDERSTEIAFMLDTLFSLIFLYDFLRRLHKAQDRGEYFFKHGGWLDLLGSLPVFPILRLLRIWRLWRILLKMRGLTLGEIWRQYRADRAGSIFWSTVMITSLVITLASFSIVKIESVSPNANITTSEDALWWAIVSVTTVGYGDLVPVTDNGRILGSFLIIIGVMLVSVLTSFVTANILTQSGNSGDHPREEVLEEIRNLDTRLEHIEEILGKIEAEQR